MTVAHSLDPPLALPPRVPPATLSTTCVLEPAAPSPPRVLLPSPYIFPFLPYVLSFTKPLLPHFPFRSPNFPKFQREREEGTILFYFLIFSEKQRRNGRRQSAIAAGVPIPSNRRRARDALLMPEMRYAVHRRSDYRRNRPLQVRSMGIARYLISPNF